MNPDRFFADCLDPAKWAWLDDPNPSHASNSGRLEMVLKMPPRFDRSSLNKLDAISKHPIIRTGLRAIDIDMRIHNTSFADITA